MCSCMVTTRRTAVCVTKSNRMISNMSKVLLVNTLGMVGWNLERSKSVHDVNSHMPLQNPGLLRSFKWHVFESQE